MKPLSTEINSNQDSGFFELTHGVDIDQFLYREELQVQKAWVEGLADLGILTAADKKDIFLQLNKIKYEFENEQFVWSNEDEDIHMAIERVVTERIGDLGKKIHTGRSRNDLIATTLKLYLAHQCEEIMNDILKIKNEVLCLAQHNLDIILPAYTHSQAAQPMRLSHIWNFHAFNFKNDINKFRACRKNLLEIMPLGSAAIAGTHINVNLTKMANFLGFDLPPQNSVHGVSDRDGLIEMAQALTFLGLHVARFCEEIIFLTSSTVRVLKLSTEWSSGSSIMPNKRNPDFFEIVRAKSKSLMLIAGELTSMNIGLSSGYVSDLHEQKRVIILAIVKVQKILPILSKAISSLGADKQRASELLVQGHILATDVANRMATSGVTFRDAYKDVAKKIIALESEGKQIGLDELSFEAAVENRNNSGGTSRNQILKSIAWLKST